jgi:hypothetical protein
LQPESAIPRTLVLVATTELTKEARGAREAVERLRALAAGGARVVAWQHSPIVQDRFRSPDVRSALLDLGIESTELAEALGETIDFEVEDAVIAWMKAFGRKPVFRGKSFRETFRLGPLVLWWWAELYLYHETPLRLLVRDVEALARLVERDSPDRIVVIGPVRELAAAARRLVSDVEVHGQRTKGPLTRFRTTKLHASDFLKMLGTGLKSIPRRRPHPAEDGGGRRVFFLTHASMWRRRREPETGKERLVEIYFDRILPALAHRAATSVVAFGPTVPFRTRRWKAWLRDLLEIGERGLPYRPVRRYFTFGMSLSLSRDFLRTWTLHREFRRTEGIDDALSHRGVLLGHEADIAFRDTFLRQFPWAIRSYRECEAALRIERPDVIVLYAESSGLGRAAILAARDQEIPSLAIQHGIMYPQYYSHEHAPDELLEDPVPIATRTAVFGEMAKDLLMHRGSYPEDRLVVTGSPKFDALVKAAEGFDRKAIRTRAAIPENGRLVVLATRWSAVGPVFAELVRAVERLDDVFLLVKPHQAESPGAYEKVVARLAAARTRILPGNANLLELLFASDGLITVDSLASSEALVLGRPVLVVNLPSNLGSLVERGVALGVHRGDSVEEGLRALLFDTRARRELEEKRQRYIQDFAFGADGRSTDRIVDLILGMAEAGKTS